MIKINGVVYNLKRFEDHVTAGVRHLVIVIHGRLKDNNNSLIIRHEGQVICGTKILPHYDQEKYSTMFMVYVP